MGTRDWRAAREGNTHARAKTKNNTPESLIVGVGASGALLAGAAIVFITLVGLVSFNVWPASRDGSTAGNMELRAAANGAQRGPARSPRTESGQLATTGPGPTRSPGRQKEVGGRGSDKQEASAGPRASTASVTSPPSSDGSGGGTGNGSGEDGGSQPPATSRGKGEGQGGGPGRSNPGQAENGKSGGDKSNGDENGSRGKGNAKRDGDSGSGQGSHGKGGGNSNGSGKGKK